MPGRGRVPRVDEFWTGSLPQSVYSRFGWPPLKGPQLLRIRGAVQVHEPASRWDI